MQPLYSLRPAPSGLLLLFLTTILHLPAYAFLIETMAGLHAPWSTVCVVCSPCPSLVAVLSLSSVPPHAPPRTTPPRLAARPRARMAYIGCPAYISWCR